MRGYPRIIAHRGGGGLAPENSLEGIVLAARLGCRGVEFDVMLAADGVPLLIHDDTVDRTHAGRGHVARLTAAEIHRLDAGRRHHPAFTGCRTPTLDEALDACRDAGLWANVEIKPAARQDVATGAAVGRAVAARGEWAGVLSSFSAEALAAAAQACPDAPRALLLEELSGHWTQRLQDTGAGALHLAAEIFTSGQASNIAKSLRDTPWACYTVNTPELADRLFALGCGAVFTDRPDRWPVSAM